MQEGHPHDPKRNKRLDGVFFNPKGNVVSLQRRTVTIELNRRAFTALYRRGVFALLLVLACGGILGFYSVAQTRADTNLYPQTCLGGWNNPEQAERVPQLDGSDYGAYNDTNSTSISNALSELYCGQFTGDIPAGTSPAKVTLTLSWAVRRTPLPVVTVSDSFASSTTDILNATTTDDGFISVEPTAVPPAETPSDTAPQEDVPVSDPQSQSFMQKILHVFALFAPSRAFAQTADTNASSKTVPDGVVEVLYTIDGATWNSLATVPASSFSNTSFELPAGAIQTWTDVAKLQIEVRTLSSADPATTIYLDGMQIDVAYVDQFPEATSTPALSSTVLQDGSVFAQADLASIEVHPVWNDGSTNIIFYQRYDGGATTYMAETRGHGDVSLSDYYAPLPPVGSYSMLEYENDNGNFDCNGISAEECAQDPHFISKSDFDVVPDATTSSDTIAPTP